MVVQLTASCGVVVLSCKLARGGCLTDEIVCQGVKKYKYFLLSAGDAFYEPPNGDTPDAAVDVSKARAVI